MRALLTLLILLCASSPAFATEFFVAPSGNDTNTGSKKSPFATLTRARDAVRALKSKGPLTEPIRVNVADGLYTINEPLILLPEDTGTKRAPIIYQAASGANPVFSGGRTIRGWQPGRQQPEPRWTHCGPGRPDSNRFTWRVSIFGRRRGLHPGDRWRGQPGSSRPRPASRHHPFMASAERRPEALTNRP